MALFRAYPKPPVELVVGDFSDCRLEKTDHGPDPYTLSVDQYIRVEMGRAAVRE